MPQDGWQTVGGKVKERKNKPSSSQQAPTNGDAASRAFSSLDAWNRDDDKPLEHGLGHTNHFAEAFKDKEVSAHDHAGNAAGSSSDDSSFGRQQQTAKPKKPKAPKVKKPTPAAAGAKLTVQSVSEVIDTARQRYAHDERVQLGLLADHLVSSFREAELPFNKLLLEQPLEKATDTPADAVPAAVSQTLTAFLEGKDAAAVAEFASGLVDAAFEGVPEAAGSSKAPAKANVGLLVMLALALRAKPQALLLLAPQLAAGGRRYSSSGRLPLLLWLLNQAARGSEAAAVAVWMRVLLPQVLGVELPQSAGGAGAAKAPSATSKPGSSGGSKVTSQAAAVAPAAADQQRLSLSPASAHQALAYLDQLLAAPGVKHAMHTGIFVQSGEPPSPIVPPPVVAALLQTVHSSQQPAGPAPLQNGVADSVRQHHRIIQTIAFSGAGGGGFDTGEMLRLALDVAGNAPSGSPSDPLIQDCARLVVDCVEADEGAYVVWQSRHKHQLRGSSRILAALDAGHPQLTGASRPSWPLVFIPAKRQALLAALPALRQRHRYALHSGKGWQGSAARTADDAAARLAAKAKRDGSTSAMRSALTTIAGGIGISLVASAALGGSISEHPMVQMVTKVAEATGAADLVQQAAAAAEPYRQQAVAAAAPYVQPLVVAASPVVQQAAAAVTPVVQQASRAAEQAVQLAFDALRNVTAAWLPGQ